MTERYINIPEGWEIVEFDDIICEKQKSKLKVSDATGFGIFPFFTSGDSVLLHNRYLIDGEHIFLATGGLANVKYKNGRVAYSSDTYAISTKETTDVKYLYYSLLNILPYINNNYFQGSGLKHLQKKDLRSHPFFIPKSLSEQKKIAEILSTADKAIEETEMLIAKYQRIKTGLMQDLLTKGIDENGNIRSEETHEFKDSPLGRIPVEWETVDLPKICTISRGKFTPRPRNNPIYYNGQYPFIQTGDISNCEEIYLNNYSQTLNEKGIAVSKKFPINTVVLTIAANIGETAILGKEMYLTDSVVGIITKMNEVFIEFSFRNIKRYLENIATQSAQKNINIEKLNKVIIKCPDDKEQLRISLIYQNIFQCLNSNKLKLSKLKKLKTGLMQDLLSGKVRVNDLLQEETL